jgi:hypothetical protein
VVPYSSQTIWYARGDRRQVLYLFAGNGPGRRGGAAGQANLALMDLLAQHGADMNARINGTLSYSFHIGYGNQNDGVNSKEGTSALHEAARSGRPDLVKRLLDLGANPNLLDGDGQKPIDVVGEGSWNGGTSCGRQRQRWPRWPRR